jgi:hypothetical protein
LPPALACRFTLAEQAVLAVVVAEVRRHGACTLALDHIAALAGVSRTTAKRALQEAASLHVVRVEERRLTAWRNLPNRVTITSPEWNVWLRLRRRGVESNSCPARISEGKKGAPSAQRATGEEGFGRRWRDRPGVQYAKE